LIFKDKLPTREKTRARDFVLGLKRCFPLFYENDKPSRKYIPFALARRAVRNYIALFVIASPNETLHIVRACIFIIGFPPKASTHNKQNGGNLNAFFRSEIAKAQSRKTRAISAVETSFTSFANDTSIMRKLRTFTSRYTSVRHKCDILPDYSRSLTNNAFSSNFYSQRGSQHE